MPWLGFLACCVWLRCFWPIADEIQTVSKSGLTILVIGLIGAILMSLGMKHLVEVQSDRDRSPYCATVESRLGAKLLGPVRIGTERDQEKVHLTVRARVLAGLDKQRIAKSAGLEVWLGALRAGARLDAVSVVLADDDGGEAEEFEILPPTTMRPKKLSAKKSPDPSKGVVPAGSSTTANGGTANKGR
jgi:hypothetical protein